MVRSDMPDFLFFVSSLSLFLFKSSSKFPCILVLTMLQYLQYCFMFVLYNDFRFLKVVFLYMHLSIRIKLIIIMKTIQTTLNSNIPVYLPFGAVLI